MFQYNSFTIRVHNSEVNIVEVEVIIHHFCIFEIACRNLATSVENGIDVFVRIVLCNSGADPLSGNLAVNSRRPSVSVLGLWIMHPTVRLRIPSLIWGHPPPPPG